VIWVNLCPVFVRGDRGVIGRVHQALFGRLSPTGSEQFLGWLSLEKDVYFELIHFSQPPGVMEPPNDKILQSTNAVKTRAVFFPFQLFGSAGAGAGAELLAEAFQEMLADNQRERLPTRAAAYQKHVLVRQLSLETLEDYQDWRSRAGRAARQAWRRDEFLLWISGNHLGVLPVYDHLAEQDDVLVIQLDAHLDIYNLADCKSELSHGNFLLHCRGKLPAVVNVGHRELLLRPEYIKQFYREAIPAADLFVQPDAVLDRLRLLTRQAPRVFIDLDCDVLDPAFFPAVTDPVPCGFSPAQVLQVLNSVWSDRVIGLAVSEFDPGRDQNDRCLAIVMWLLEFVLLQRYEKPGGEEARIGAV
jgi:arginase family enzyme